MTHRRTLITILTASSFALAPLTGCAMEDTEPQAPTENEATGELATTSSNPAAFDLHCLYNGEAYASRAPNPYAAQAIRYACEAQGNLVAYPYTGFGMWPLQFRTPLPPDDELDCSGLTAHVWYRATSGFVQLPHSAAGQESILPHVPFGQERPGDLIFYYSPTANSGRHVALYMGDGLMIEASSPTRGIVVSAVRPGPTSIGRMGGGG